MVIGLNEDGHDIPGPTGLDEGNEKFGVEVGSVSKLKNDD